MPHPRRLLTTLLHRGLPPQTRLGLLAAEGRRRLRPRPAYAVRYGATTLYLSHADYEIDWETLKSVLVDEPYPADYRGALVLDVGAHKGYFGAYALRRGASRVVSYEPEQANLALLERTAREHAGAWEARPVAVGAEAGEADLHVMGASWGHALHPPDAFAQYEVGVRRVPVVALADVLREAGEAGAERVVVKLNVEGEECPTILGTPPEAWQRVDEVLVETHPWAACGAEELAEHLAGAGLTRVPGAHERMLQLRRG